ncbi:MAG: Mth938-like domain-containing protein [Rhodospirillales bacterium]|nr:Mth938-like domain-containing protein [Rhodospirillales bacterium]
MDIAPQTTPGRQVIESYGAGRFTVSGILYKGSSIVTPERVLAWPVTDFADATPESLAALTQLAEPVALLLLGSGAEQVFLRPALRQAFKDRLGLAVECMTSGAACRTYSVLMNEGRRVAAALIAVD